MKPSYKAFRNFEIGSGWARHVRFGSLADMTARSRHVRFAPIADICQLIEHVCFVP
jgi:hypothetical protein